MSKLLSMVVAAMFAAVSVSAFAASHAGAMDKKGDSKMEKSSKMDKKEGKKAKAPKKKADKMEKKS
jgi:hypothetical protein